TECRWYDYHGILVLLHAAIKNMEDEKHCPYAYTVGWEKNRCNMRVCIYLLERLIEDEYTTNKLNFINDENSDWGWRIEKKYDLPTKTHIYKRLEGRLKQQDLDLLTTLLRKHLLSWWD